MDSLKFNNCVIEFLNSLDVPALPSHKLRLKDVSVRFAHGGKKNHKHCDLGDDTQKKIQR